MAQEMTEAEWSECESGRDLLFECRDRFLKWTGARTPRLLACAACRLEWDKLTDPRSRAAIDVAERYCDGGVTRKALTEAHREAVAAWRGAQGKSAGNLRRAASKASHPTKPIVAMEDTLTIITAGADNPWDEMLAVMIRDAFGPRLFRQVVINPRWRTEDTLGLARGIYEDRAFDRLPQLADALMDAGCDNDRILAHCHSPGPHVRGCWVVDLVLGKE